MRLFSNSNCGTTSGALTTSNLLCSDVTVVSSAIVFTQAAPVGSACAPKPATAGAVNIEQEITIGCAAPS